MKRTYLDRWRRKVFPSDSCDRIQEALTCPSRRSCLFNQHKKNHRPCIVHYKNKHRCHHNPSPPLTPVTRPSSDPTYRSIGSHRSRRNARTWRTIPRLPQTSSCTAGLLDSPSHLSLCLAPTMNFSDRRHSRSPDTNPNPLPSRPTKRRPRRRKTSITISNPE